MKGFMSRRKPSETSSVKHASSLGPELSAMIGIVALSSSMMPSNVRLAAILPD